MAMSHNLQTKRCRKLGAEKCSANENFEALCKEANSFAHIAMNVLRSKMHGAVAFTQDDKRKTFQLMGCEEQERQALLPCKHDE
jgi:hypothetical protein